MRQKPEPTPFASLSSSQANKIERSSEERSVYSLVSHSLLHQLRYLLDEERMLLASKMQPSLPLTPSSSHQHDVLEEELFHLARTIQAGFELIQAQAKNQENTLLKKAMDEFLIALRPLKNATLYTKALLEFHSGKSWQEVLSLSRDSLSHIYLFGKKFYETGLFEESSEIFGFIAWIDSKNCEIWTILGHSLYHASHYRRAISAYTVAYTIKPENTWAYIYASQASEAIGDYEKSSFLLHQALESELALNEKSDTNLIEYLKHRIASISERQEIAFS